MEEGLRFCEMLKEDLEAHAELPETPEATQELLRSYVQVMRNARCLFLALCNLTAEKGLEAAALMDLLQDRLEGETLGKKGLDPPLGNLHPFFQAIEKELPVRVARWRCSVRAQICLQAKAAEEKKEKDQEGDEGAEAEKAPEAWVEIPTAWPPPVKSIACKPLLFDLAFPLITAPDIDHLLPKKKEEKQGLIRGLTSKALGGVGSRIGSLWGRK